MGGRYVRGKDDSNTSMVRCVRRRNQSHPLARDDGAVNNDGHGDKSRLRFITTVKQFVPRFFLCSCTCLILGLGPQTKTTQYDDSSRSRHVTLYHTYPLGSKPSSFSVSRKPEKTGDLRTPTPP
jgi:hypothetical protein